MAEQNQDQERTEKATPFKLREAKKRGQVAKSLEVNSLLLLGGMLFLSFMLADRLIQGQLILSQNLLGYDASTIATIDGFMVLLERMIDGMIDLYWPLVAVIVLIAVIGNMVQTGPVFSFFPLKPDAKRLNPVAGFKRLFSKKMLYESVKTFIKMIAFSAIAYFCIVGLLPTLVTLIDVAPESYNAALIQFSQSLVAKLLLAVLLVALLDLLYTRWDYLKQMRMSPREVKEEVKRREGDPLIRAKRRELQKEAAKRAGSINKVPDADVLITNPTHLALALKFDAGEMAAPVVIAKGAGELALKMRQKAAKHRVSIVENKPLARALFKKIDIDQPIHEELYPHVAKIYAWLSAKETLNPPTTAAP